MAFSRSTLINSTIWKLLERFSSQAVSLVVSIVLARLLMPSDYGIVAIVLVFINLSNVIIDGGLNTALVQKQNADNIDFSTIFIICMGLALFIYLILYFTAPFIAKFYDNELLIPVLRVLSINLFINSLNSIQRAYVSKHMLFKKLFICSFVSVVVSGVIGILMAYYGYGVWALVAQYLFSSATTAIIMWFTVKWRPIFVFSIDKFRGLFDYGWKIFLTNFIIAIYEDIRSLVIGKMYNPASLAYFDRGKQFPNLMVSNVSSSLQTVLLPAISDIQDDRARVKQLMRRSMNLTHFFILPLLIGLMAAAEPFVVCLLTEKWIDAIPFLRIFCIAFMMMPIQSFNMCAIKALGYSGTTLKLEIMKKIIEAIILIVSFSIGVYAVAWGVVLYNFICIFINLYPNQKYLNYSVVEQIGDMIPILIPCICMGAIVYSVGFLGFSNLVTLILQFAIGFLSYILFCKIFRLETLDYVLSMLNKGQK